ncbi:uncharacterized protein LOC123722211 [Papilio machaon]|uniref:uncharacterized protein LOC123722211 n=1 Tax=Papilio machaon TaxID=76193 RepID=UPI001E665EFB|nr:uncharacterized protein LOC123722211 [Papilio machaon]
MEEELYQTYRADCLALQVAIAKAKQGAWEEWLQTLEEDPWGRPYRAVRKKLRPWAPPITTTMEPQLAEEVVGALFPHRVGSALPAEEEGEAVNDEVEPVSEQEVTGSASRRPPPGWTVCLVGCLKKGRFPSSWKEGRLVLLKKDDRPPDQASAYRPIVLLGEPSKLFERVLVARLAEHIHLCDAQFGFRCGRSTIDAVSRLKGLAEEVVAQGGVLVAVSLDISNAFNTLPWTAVMEALQHFRVPGHL